MHVAQVIWMAIMILAATACIITANVMFYQILDEVNAQRPSGQQISFLFVRARVFDVLRQHAGFFPSSRKRKSTAIWIGAGFALLLLTFLSGFLHG
jgi:hypothetical protein